jgi:hypothetical protein
VLVRVRSKAAWDSYLRRALLRAEAQDSFHRVGHGQQVCSVGRRMCSCIVREGRSGRSCEAELHGGCGMLAVEAMVVPGRCCRWLFVVPAAQPRFPTPHTSAYR